MDYYVYVFLDPRKPGIYRYNDLIFDFEPYYVGKGNKQRIKKHFFEYHLDHDNNKLKTNKIRKIIEAKFNPEDFAVKLKTDLVEEESLKLEMEIISKIGRKNANLGPLTNLTDGGDGLSGHICKNKGKAWEEIIGIEKAEKYKLEMSRARMGENNPNFGNKMKTGKPVKQLDLENNLIKIWGCIREASEQLNIPYGIISKCLSPSDKTKIGKGFKWEYLDRPNPKNQEKDKRFFTYEVTFPSGEVKIINNLSELARNEKLSNSFFTSLSSGKRKSKYWKCKKL